MSVQYLEEVTGESYLKSKIDELQWQKRGLMETATGYGRKLTTRYKVFAFGRWFRVYAHCFSNCASLYILSKGKRYYIKYEDSLVGS